MQQYNTVVTYIKSNEFGVHPNSLLDFVKHLCNSLWEIDLHYEKFKALSNVVKRNTLKFKKPQSHAHKPKQLKSQELYLKLDKLLLFWECGHFTSKHMFTFTNIVKGIHDSVLKYINYLA